MSLPAWWKRRCMNSATQRGDGSAGNATQETMTGPVEATAMGNLLTQVRASFLSVTRVTPKARCPHLQAG